MNEQVASRAWQKAMEQQDLSLRDWIRGAVCYYRGMSKTASPGTKIIARDLERGLRAYNATNSTAELDHVMKQRLNKERQYARLGPISKAVVDAANQHWAQLSTSQIVRKALQSTKGDELWQDRETGITTAKVRVTDLKESRERYDHQFDAETLQRMKRVYEQFGDAADQWKTAEDFIDGFYFDMNPYSEVRIYEKMAEAFRLFFLLIGKVGKQEGSPGPLHPDDLAKLRFKVFNSLLMMTFGNTDNPFDIDPTLYTVLGSLYAMNGQGEVLKQAIESDHEL